MPKKQITVAVSGGFDPIHVGHLRMFQQAKKLGTRLVVILNNDNWLREKKGFVFMSEKERAELIRAIHGVDEVVITKHKLRSEDKSVTKELADLRPDIFANGGDRKKQSDIPETEVCKRYGIKMVFNIGGGKVQSSSWLTSKVIKVRETEYRPWGKMETYERGKSWWVKTLTIDAGHQISLQSHKERGETWVCVGGELDAIVFDKDVSDGEGRLIHMTLGAFVSFGPGQIHRLSSKTGGTIIEVAVGTPDEKDIKRYADNYGRT